MVLHSAFSEMDTSSVQFIFVLKGYCESQKTVWWCNLRPDGFAGRRDDRYDGGYSDRGPPPRSRDLYGSSPPRDTGRGSGLLDRSDTPPHIYHLGHDIACGLPVTCGICCWQNFKVAVSVTELTLCIAMRESRCWVAAVVCNIHRFLCKFKLK